MQRSKKKVFVAEINYIQTKYYHKLFIYLHNNPPTCLIVRMKYLLYALFNVIYVNITTYEFPFLHRKETAFRIKGCDEPKEEKKILG